MTHCLVCGEEGRALCGPHWRALPLELRRRWWRETSYGNDGPSTELIAEIKRAVVTVRTSAASDWDKMWRKPFHKPELT